MATSPFTAGPIFPGLKVGQHDGVPSARAAYTGTFRSNARSKYMLSSSVLESASLATNEKDAER